MEKQEIEEENILENEEGHSGELTAEEREGDRKCVRIREPTKPGNGGNVPLDAQRRKARLWRKKRILNEFQSRKCKLKGECINDTPGPRNIPKPRKGDLNLVVSFTDYVIVCYFYSITSSIMRLWESSF